jgi:hypothetical protein
MTGHPQIAHHRNFRAVPRANRFFSTVRLRDAKERLPGQPGGIENVCFLFSSQLRPK